MSYLKQVKSFFGEILHEIQVQGTRNTRPKQKVVYVSLNGVLRDFWNKALVEYHKYYIETPPEVVEGQEAFEYGINNDIETSIISEKMRFVDEQEKNYFLYVDFAMEIFGHASPVYKTVMMDLNKFILENPDKKVVIVSQETGRSVPATLFFLSKTICGANHIRFYQNESEIESLWHDCDTWITDDPTILSQKPWFRESIKVTKPYNQDSESCLTINAFSELLKPTNEPKEINNPQVGSANA